LLEVRVMGDKTKIGWTAINGLPGATWNPLRGTARPGSPGAAKNLAWACLRISPACDFCYAATLNGRMGNGLPFLGQDVQTLHEETLTQPLRWSKPRGIFVCSMTDLFWDPKEAGGGQGTTDDQLDAIFDVMERAHWHTYQILTKRAERMATYLCARYPHGVPAHLWVGATCENQTWAERRLEALVRVPAAVRWVSYEPVLGDVDWTKWLDQLDWIVFGGESGPHVYDPAQAGRFLVQRVNGAWVPTEQGLRWYQHTLQQCRRYGVAAYMKQFGGPTPGAASCDLLVKEFPTPRRLGEVRQLPLV
jgi:protein gp37